MLTELADRPAGRLSGGEQRRLHTAIAVVHRPRVVLLDEPTAGADTQTRSAILRAVLDLASDGAAVVYTTHYLPEVEELDAGVALLEAGRIIATGAVSELIAQHAESVVEITYTDGRVERRPGTSLHGLGDDVIRAEVIKSSLEAAYLALTGTAVRRVIRNELRLLRHDPVPAAVLVGMPLVLMTLLSDAMGSTLASNGFEGAPGSAQTVPGHGVRVRVVRDRGRRLRHLPRARLAHVAAAARRGPLGAAAARRASSPSRGCWSPPSTSSCSASACCSWTWKSAGRGSPWC